MKKIEQLDNVFIDQLKMLIREALNPELNFSLDYYIGKDNNGVRGMCFDISSKFGLVFRRFAVMKGHEIVADIEEDFITKVLNDLVLAGITFMNVEAFARERDQNVAKDIYSKPFRHSLPRKIFFVN